MSEAFIGRQPIYDRNLELSAYELLFRSGEVNRAVIGDGDQATSTVILTAFTEIGLDKLVGPHRAFLNLTRNFLLGEGPWLLPPERVVLEILEDMVVDEALLAAVRALRRRGFLLALDDFVGEARWQPLLEHAAIVKMDVRALGIEAARSEARRLRRCGAQLLAEKVETRAEFDALVNSGFELFQGYFIARPQVVRGRKLPAERLAVLQLLAVLQAPQTDIDEVEMLVRRDVTLSYRLLRLINSAFFALPAQISSVRRAVVYLGLDSLKRWLSLLVLASVSGKPHELIRMALLRARMCEGLCQRGSVGDPSAGFTAGLFSTLDALMDAPLAELLDGLPLAQPIKNALLAHGGGLGEALNCTLAYERCDWARVRCADLDAAIVREIWIEAAEWSLAASGGLRESTSPSEPGLAASAAPPRQAAS